MHSFHNKSVLVLIITIIVLSVIAYFIFNNVKREISIIEEVSSTVDSIGQSVEGREITAYTFGDGSSRIIFIGGMHGGYEWNSVYLSYRFIDYLKDNLGIIPDNLAITIIPSVNPDGLYKVTKKEGRFTVDDIPDNNLDEEGRFNSNKVDLNRNFDCRWKPESLWQNKVVSAGASVFSEPETRAVRDFVLDTAPKAVIFWHSKANAVYASECEKGILPETLSIMNIYSKASGYKAIQSFDAYDITGDAEGWLASIGIPAITVELKTHETIEWDKNLAGITAILEYFSENDAEFKNL